MPPQNQDFPDVSKDLMKTALDNVWEKIVSGLQGKKNSLQLYSLKISFRATPKHGEFNESSTSYTFERSEGSHNPLPQNNIKILSNKFIKFIFGLMEEFTKVMLKSSNFDDYYLSPAFSVIFRSDEQLFGYDVYCAWCVQPGRRRSCQMVVNNIPCQGSCGRRCWRGPRN
jgi:hypothetical protein